MGYKSDILLHSASLQAGENVRVDCPACGGADRTLSITLAEDGTLLWQCFRATCDLGSAAKVNIHGRTAESTPLVKGRKKFEGLTEPLREGELEWIRSHWGITNPPYWYHTDAAGSRVAMSIRSPKWVHRGWVLRSINPTSTTKALTYLNTGEEGLSWYKTNGNAPTVLVEDIPSAVRASSVMNAVALLGTGVGMNKAIEIAKYAPKPIIVALDQDAIGLSFYHKRRYDLLWGGDVRVMTLNKDMKDMKEDELCQLLDTSSAMMD